MTALDLAQQLRARFGELISEPHEFRGEITVMLADANRITEICLFARGSLGFDFLVDVSSVDNYGDDPRWTVVYELYGLAHKCHLRLKTNVSEEVSELPTVTGVWRTADWHEREIYDLMGIRFSGHPDLRRIIMWEGYPYHPLRKDFPVAGKPTELPEVAFSRTAPIEGGPFVTTPGGRDAIEREPRVRVPEDASAS
jgi:NADH-quinone oxidoreductase subunit C